MERHSTGIAGLDEKLGGGLLPGTMTVLAGSSGIGKTQFGLQYANAGLKQEKQRGFVFDTAARIDPQGHQEYAERMFGWKLGETDYRQALSYKGQRLTRRDLNFDQWNDWQAELSKNLDDTIAFFFQHFVSGTRRCVIDGIEPVEHQAQSIQFELLEYIYHQIIRKDPDWVARDLYRQHYREHAQEIAEHLYRKEDISCVVNYTAAETSLEALIDKPMDEGDLFAGANTIIYLGKIRIENGGLYPLYRRAMYISKHRGSVCSDEILFYDINDSGLFLCPSP